MKKVHSLDDKYLAIILEALAVCKNYKPKFGKGSKAGFSLYEFQKLYQQDAFYAWFGLDSPLIYAAHRAAGGMTSVYRQIGIACERLFCQVLQDDLKLKRTRLPGHIKSQVLVEEQESCRLMEKFHSPIFAIPDV